MPTKVQNCGNKGVFVQVNMARITEELPSDTYANLQVTIINAFVYDVYYCNYM